MKKECKHEWHEINPFQKICCNCNKVANSEHLKSFSQKDLERPIDSIIIDDEKNSL